MTDTHFTPIGRIARVLEYVRAHLDEQLTVGSLAAHAGFSPYHFQRIFLAGIGETIGDYVRRQRLARAAFRLRETSSPVTEIALESGYATASAFTRAFAAHYGLTPSAIRAGLQPGEAPMEIRIDTLPAYRVLALRNEGPYSELGRVWDAVIPLLADRGLLGNQRIGLSYDNPEAVDLDALRYDAGVVVSGAVAGDARLQILNISAGRYAIYRHRGSYELIGHAFDAVIERVYFTEGMTLRDAPCIELYRNHPYTTAVDDLVTDLAVPVH